MPGVKLEEVGGELVIDVPEEKTVIGRGNFLQVRKMSVYDNLFLFFLSIIIETYTLCLFLYIQLD